MSKFKLYKCVEEQGSILKFDKIYVGVLLPGDSYNSNYVSVVIDGILDFRHWRYDRFITLEENSELVKVLYG